MDEIETNIAWIEKVSEVETLFEQNLKGSLSDLQSLYKKIEADDGFKGDASEGFLEVFDIMLQYQEALIEELPPFYKAFKTYKKDLNEIKSEAVYAALDD